jgi:hypothetical protein
MGRRVALARKVEKMKGALVEKAEQIKWWNALGDLSELSWHRADVEKLLRKARECRHPDAQWLASLFPVDKAVTHELMEEVLLELGDDPRALFLRWRFSAESSRQPLRRAAELGFAPAQAQLARKEYDFGGEPFVWAQRAMAQGDRDGFVELGRCLLIGRGCDTDNDKAVEMFRKAAELECPRGQDRYGIVGFGRLDWERYHWWGLAVLQGYRRRSFCGAVLELLHSFEQGELGRVLHTVAPVIAVGINVAKEMVFDDPYPPKEMARFERVIVLHDAMLRRARIAIDCWSVAGRRCGVAKDIRVMIAKLAWEEVWRWSAIL